MTKIPQYERGVQGSIKMSWKWVINSHNITTYLSKASANDVSLHNERNCAIKRMLFIALSTFNN